MFFLDKYLFEKLGASGCSGSDYRVFRSTCCNRQIVEDDELSDLYFDSTNLSKKLSLLGRQGDPVHCCPLCGETRWDLIPIDGVADVSEEWWWACRRE